MDQSAVKELKCITSDHTCKKREIPVIYLRNFFGFSAKFQAENAKSILHPSHRLRQHHLRWRQHHLRWKQHHLRQRQHHLRWRQHHFRWKQHHFLSIFTIYAFLSRLTHFFRKYFLAKIAFSATSHVFCMYGWKAGLQNKTCVLSNFLQSFVANTQFALQDFLVLTICRACPTIEIEIYPSKKKSKKSKLYCALTGPDHVSEKLASSPQFFNLSFSYLRCTSSHLLATYPHNQTSPHDQYTNCNFSCVSAP